MNIKNDESLFGFGSHVQLTCVLYIVYHIFVKDFECKPWCLRQLQNLSMLYDFLVWENSNFPSWSCVNFPNEVNFKDKYGIVVEASIVFLVIRLCLCLILLRDPQLLFVISLI
jgi:hypothetical protein